MTRTLMRCKFAILLLSLLSALSLSAAELVGKVTKVSDGDTIWVTDASGKREKIRMDRIDAPESKQAYGKEATAALAQWILNRSVRVEYKKRDQYGRVLGIVYAATNGIQNVDINLTMVATGNAWHYSYFDKTPAYIEAERSARANKLGLWATPNPVNPYLFRRQNR